MADRNGRKERLAQALRENLRRRKEQARGRAAGGDGDPDPAGVPGGGEEQPLEPEARAG